MIRPLRTAHRRIFLALAMALPVAFAISVAARKSPAVAGTLPPALAPAPDRFNASIWHRTDLFPQTGIGAGLMRESADRGAFAIRFQAAEHFARPDLIVYWFAGATISQDTLPESARLLGAFWARALPLPADLTDTEGRLIVFSLADQEIVEVSNPFRISAAR
jgi:hypothetical protein